MPVTQLEKVTGEDRGGLAAAILAEQIRLLLLKRIDLPINLVNAGIVSATFWPLYPGWVVALWLGVFSAVVLARTLIRFGYRRAAPGPETAPRWGRIFTLNTFATGCLWGLTGSVILVTPDPLYHVFLAFVLGGMMAGGVVTNAAYMPAMLAFMLPTILPVIVLLLSRANLIQVEMGVMLAAFAAVIMIAGRNINRSIVENFGLRIEQGILLVKVGATEAALAEAQAISHVGSWDIDLQTNSVAWSAETFRMFGTDPATFQPTFETLLARVHPDDRAALRKDYAEALAAGSSPGIDHRIVMNDGAIKWLHEVGQVHYDAEGRAVRANGIVQDITDGKLAAGALALRDRLLHAVTAGTGVLAKAATLDQGMPDALRIVGESLRVDRVLVMQESAGPELPPAMRYFWQAQDILTAFDLSSFSVPATDFANLAAWRAPLLKGDHLIAQLATSEGPVRAMLEFFHNQSTLMVPIFVGHKLWGSIVIDSCSVARDWTAGEIDTLKTFGEIAGSLIVHDETRLSLQFANILLETQMEASPDGILVVNPARKVIAFNRRFSDMWNVPLTDLTAGVDETVLAKVISQVKDPGQFATRVKYLFDHPGEVGQDEVETTDGRFLERHTVTLHSPALANLGRVWFFRDITERKQAAAQALRMARYDVLTGLANRSVFVEAVQQAIAKAKRGEKGFAVIYLDLDHFKDVNDTLGHPAGDELLKAVADRLRANMREIDTVARFGGDEFAVVVAEIGEPADAAMLADRVINAFGDPFSIQGNDIRSGASIGIDLYGPEAPDPETLLSHADVALYRAKAEGRGTYRFFTEAMDAEVRTRVQLGAELRVAVATGQLFLLYQPQVAIGSGRMVGVEALVRWRHPTRGVLEPEIFIPLAEKSGSVVKLGQWVLATACRQGKAWFDAGIAPFRIAVNVSALQFKLPLALETGIAATLAETGFPPHLLELELTESVLMEVSEDRSDILRRLGRTGITIAIDDFGIGYSSLDYLRRFPVDRIKVAQTFVTHLETVPGDGAIVRATIGLARELGIMIIAEGVETPAQFDLLKAWGCGEVQGFYFSQPLTGDAIAALVRDGGILQPLQPLQPRLAGAGRSQLQPTAA